MPHLLVAGKLHPSGLELLLFGAVIVGVVLLRPAGLAGEAKGHDR